MFQGELAKYLGVDRVSVQNWERNMHSPANAIMPKIIAWLGYDPERYALPIGDHLNQTIVEAFQTTSGLRADSE